eukprot:6208836-Pleurochrysis_carterae.AAC.2
MARQQLRKAASTLEMGCDVAAEVLQANFEASDVILKEAEQEMSRSLLHCERSLVEALVLAVSERECAHAARAAAVLARSSPVGDNAQAEELSSSLSNASLSAAERKAAAIAAARRRIELEAEARKDADLSAAVDAIDAEAAAMDKAELNDAVLAAEAALAKYRQVEASHPQPVDVDTSLLPTPAPPPPPPSTPPSSLLPSPMPQQSLSQPRPSAPLLQPEPSPLLTPPQGAQQATRSLSKQPEQQQMPSPPPPLQLPPVTPRPPPTTTVPSTPAPSPLPLQPSPTQSLPQPLPPAPEPRPPATQPSLHWPQTTQSPLPPRMTRGQKAAAAAAAKSLGLEQSSHEVHGPQIALAPAASCQTDDVDRLKNSNQVAGVAGVGFLSFEVGGEGRGNETGLDVVAAGRYGSGLVGVDAVVGVVGGVVGATGLGQGDAPCPSDLGRVVQVANKRVAPLSRAALAARKAMQLSDGSVAGNLPTGVAPHAPEPRNRAAGKSVVAPRRDGRKQADERHRPSLSSDEHDQSSLPTLLRWNQGMVSQSDVSGNDAGARAGNSAWHTMAPLARYAMAA